MRIPNYCLALAVAAIGAATIHSQAAEAATFDFADVADKLGGPFAVTGGGTIVGGEGGWTSIVGAGVRLLDTGSGISVVRTATNSAGGNTVDTYLDKGSAGLGVCSGFNGSQCNPANDDNVGAIGGSGNVNDGSFETLILTFSELVRLDEVIFAGEGHGDFNGSVTVNGTDETPINNALMLGLVGTEFTFRYIPLLNSVANEFYLDSVTVSAVPLPAALPLFLSMLAGMGFPKVATEENRARGRLTAVRTMLRQGPRRFRPFRPFKPETYQCRLSLSGCARYDGGHTWKDSGKTSNLPGRITSRVRISPQASYLVEPTHQLAKPY